jgi:hypothetical protein
MSLDDRAKSYLDIKADVEAKAQKLIDLAQKNPDDNVRMQMCRKAWAEGCLLETNKDYVLLKDAKEETARLTSIIETEQLLNNAEWKRRITIESKITEANKVLDQFLDLYSAHYEINTKLMDQLRAILSQEETRKEP